MGEFVHPPERSTKPLTGAQMDLLQRVVASNGGGVSASDENHAVIAALVRRHLIQGKAGNLSRLVHTPLGLTTARAARTGGDSLPDRPVSQSSGGES